MLFVLLILLSFTIVVYTTTAADVQVGLITKPNVAVRSKDDVINVRQFGRLPMPMIVPPLAVLPLGSLVTWSTNHQFLANHSMLLIMYPYVGYVDVTSVMTVDPSAPISSLSLFTSLPMLFSAGKSVLASRRLSLAWVDQWPVGTGAMGALVGGDISEEMIPLSIADLFAIDKNSYLKHYKEKLSSPTINVDAFRAAREALINNDIKEAEKFVGKIRGSPEGRFEYTADLILSFYRRKGPDVGKKNEKSNNDGTGTKDSSKKEKKDTKKVVNDGILSPMKSVKNIFHDIMTQPKHPPRPQPRPQVGLTHLMHLNISTLSLIPIPTLFNSLAAAAATTTTTTRTTTATVAASTTTAATKTTMAATTTTKTTPTTSAATTTTTTISSTIDDS